jgi:hypothetical protein
MFGMNEYNMLIGVFLSVIFILSALLHIRENTKLEARFKKKLDPEVAAWMTRFAWSRTLQLLGALGLCIIVFINYDKELADSRNSLDTLTAMVERKDKIEQEALKQQQAVANAPAPITKPLASVAAAPVQQAPAPVATPATPATSTTPATATTIVNTAALQPSANLPATTPAIATEQAYVAPEQPVSPVNNAPTIKLPSPTTTLAAPNIEESPITPPAEVEVDDDGTVLAEDDNSSDSEENRSDQTQLAKNETIEALYNPPSDGKDQQSGMDDIKKRYEDILVIHLFLKKCKKVKPNDIKVINHAISQEILALDAPKQLQKDIINAAQGSYNEVYAKSPCNGRGIRDLQAQYHNYIDVLRNNFPM